MKKFIYSVLFVGILANANTIDTIYDDMNAKIWIQSNITAIQKSNKDYQESPCLSNESKKFYAKLTADLLKSFNKNGEKIFKKSLKFFDDKQLESLAGIFKTPEGQKLAKALKNKDVSFFSPEFAYYDEEWWGEDLSLQDYQNLQKTITDTNLDFEGFANHLRINLSPQNTKDNPQFKKILQEFQECNNTKPAGA